MAAAASSGRGGGGSVFDLADTLLESLQQASGGGADPRVAGAACGKGPAEPPEAASTISLLEDCLECLWRGGGARGPPAEASRGGGSPGGAGSRVSCGGRSGMMQSYVVVPSLACSPLPPGLDFAEGASFNVAYTTAYHCLVERAQLTAADRTVGI